MVLLIGHEAVWIWALSPPHHSDRWHRERKRQRINLETAVTIQQRDADVQHGVRTSPRDVRLTTTVVTFPTLQRAEAFKSDTHAPSYCQLSSAGSSEAQPRFQRLAFGAAGAELCAATLAALC